MSRTAVIIQARMASSRLPGKVMLELAGTTVLHHVLRRCLAISEADVVCCAIPKDTSCDPIAEEADLRGVMVFRGEEGDVLSRYAGAARALDAEIILRVTSDCPLIDPSICNDVLRLRRDSGADYACNNMPPSFPHGLDCEAFTRKALERAEQLATEPRQREHVTSWLRESPSVKRANLKGPGGASAVHRWTLDYPDDLTFFRRLFDLCPTAGHAGMAELLDIMQKWPELTSLNRLHHDAHRVKQQNSDEETSA